MARRRRALPPGRYHPGGAWWPEADGSEAGPRVDHVTCIPHNFKNMVDRWSSMAKEVAEGRTSGAGTASSSGAGTASSSGAEGDDVVDELNPLRDGEEFFRWRRVLDVLDDGEVEVRAALIGAADKQHTNVKRALVDSQRLSAALWEAMLIREAAVFGILSNFLSAILDTGLTHQVRRFYIRAAHTLAVRSLGLELTQSVTRMRHRVMLSGQAQNMLAATEIILDVTRDHPSQERALGDNTPLEHRFAELYRPWGDRGNAEQVVCTLVKSEAVSSLGRRRSRKYTMPQGKEHANDWNDGGGLRMHAWMNLLGYDLSSYKREEGRLDAHARAQKYEQGRDARKAGRGKDATTRTYQARHVTM